MSVSNIVELPVVLTNERRKELQAALAIASDLISNLQQVERQLWGVLSVHGDKRFSVADHVLALRIAKGTASDSFDTLVGLVESMQATINRIENR